MCIRDRNVGLGKDHTIFSLIEGTVSFKKLRNGGPVISVDPIAEKAN